MTEVQRQEKQGDARVVAVVACDLERSPIGTASRLGRPLGGVPVLVRTLGALRQVRGVDHIVLMAPEGQMAAVMSLVGGGVEVLPLTPRPEGLDARVRAARAWNLSSWRGGAGQWTVFDEDFHPGAVAAAVKRFGAAHVLCVAGHAAFLDAELTTALLHHHLHKNHEMRLTYTPAAPGLGGIVMHADMALELGEKTVMPGQLLGYDPRSPTFDTLIREACMQVDPALSKIPNRFLVDTDRTFALAERLVEKRFDCAASLALAAAALRGQGPGYGVTGDGFFRWPREVEIELTGRRLTSPVGGVRAPVREARGELAGSHWVSWLGRQRFADDLLVTFCGDGDPLLYGDLPEVLGGARAAGVRNLHVQTDLAGDITALVAAIGAGNVDVLSVNFYGDDAATYGRVGGADLHARVISNMEALAGALGGSGLPLVVPRLLKVRETIPQLEGFFDRWVVNAGWAVIDPPTDRAGSVPFGAVVDMAPPKRKPCRRLAERLLIRSNGTAVACDQDVRDVLRLGHIESHTLEQMWHGDAARALRCRHAAGSWNDVVPCVTCREWHR